MKSSLLMRPGFADTNACTSTPCGVNARCSDKPPPAVGDAAGRTCICDAGYAGNHEAGCEGDPDYMVLSPVSSESCTALTHQPPTSAITQTSTPAPPPHAAVTHTASIDARPPMAHPKAESATATRGMLATPTLAARVSLEMWLDIAGVRLSQCERRW